MKTYIPHTKTNPTFDHAFKDKETFFAWIRQWRANYKELSAEIRAAKAARNKRHRENLPFTWTEAAALEHMRGNASLLLDSLHAAKEAGAHLFEAANVK